MRREAPAEHELEDELRHVSPAHLRRAEERCPRRLALELAGQRNRNRRSDARFAVATRLEGDVRTAHATMRAATPTDFPVPNDLWPEQQRLHRAAATGYVALFAGTPARAVDAEAVDPFGTDVPDSGVRLTGGIGVALELSDGRAEIRALHIGARGFGRPLLDDVDLHLAALRAATWRDRGPLQVVAADVLGLAIEEITLDLDVALPAARAFLAERVARIAGLTAAPTARAGADCAGCGFVAGCGAHSS